MISSDHAWMLALALVLDAVFGDPDWLWRRLPHPVVAFGALVSWLDRNLNPETSPSVPAKVAGTFALVVIVVVAAALGWGLEKLFDFIAYGWIGMVIVVAVMLAGRGLHDHVAAVARAYETGGIDAARGEIVKIVGRDPANLDEAGVSRAAIESLAENFSDGLAAPAFWFGLLGLPGLFAYKAINTADSMIGHRSPRHREFGWATARLDDLVNWPAARLSAAFIALAAPIAGSSVAAALRVVKADARRHRSPNAGWPEAAIAGALGVALSGPRSYDGVSSDEPFLNQEGRQAGIPDIGQALRVYTGAWVLVLLVAAILSPILP